MTASALDLPVTKLPACGRCRRRFWPARTDARYCSNACRQGAYPMRLAVARWQTPTLARLETAACADFPVPCHWPPSCRSDGCWRLEIAAAGGEPFAEWPRLPRRACAPETPANEPVESSDEATIDADENERRRREWVSRGL